MIFSRTDSIDRSGGSHTVSDEKFRNFSVVVPLAGTYDCIGPAGCRARDHSVVRGRVNTRRGA